MRIVYTILLFVCASALAYAETDSLSVSPSTPLSVAERNALQGFNDTIDRLAPNFVTVSLCVADPTDQTQDYLGITGHAFLRLQCPTFGLDYCFSYESEKIKGQLLDYLTGKLKMGMFSIPTNEYVEDYRVWKCAVYEYRINIPPAAKLRLWEQMDNHMLEEQNIQMDLLKFGCTNTILRYVEKAVSPDIIVYDWPEKYKQKNAFEIAEENLRNYPWSMLGLRIVSGRQLQALRTPKQKVIFPMSLLEVWSNATLNGEPMLTYLGNVVEAEGPLLVITQTWFTPHFCAILLLIIIAAAIVCCLVIHKRKTYPLLPFSQLVHDVLWWIPNWLTLFTVQYRVKGVSFNKAMVVAQKTLSNHPIFKTRIDCRGRQYINERANVLKGPYHNIKIKEESGDLNVQVGFNRILGDEHSIRILIEDAVRSYLDLPLEKDDYVGYLEYVEREKQSKHYADSKIWLEEQFVDESIPVRPTIDRKSINTLLPWNVGIMEKDFADLHGDINKFLQKELLTIDGFFSLCAALAIAEYCGTSKAALSWAYKGRARMEEQHIFGSLHKDVPFKITVNNNREQLIKQARNQIRFGIAHSDYPYTLTKPYTKRWNYAVNVIHVADWNALLQQAPVEIELLSWKPLKYAYALLDVEIHEHADSLSLWFRYSATHYKESSIRRFASLIRQYAEWLIN